MREIPLTQGLVTKVSDEDYDYLMKWKWHAVKKRKHFYAYRNEYIPATQKSKHIAMHRVILNVTDSKTFVDHKDQDSLNNDRENLRIANCSQNNFNCCSRKNSTSKYLGVHWDSTRKKWAARIQTYRVLKCIGRFDDEKEAAKAYDYHAINLHGEFASLNNVHLETQLLNTNGAF